MFMATETSSLSAGRILVAIVLAGLAQSLFVYVFAPLVGLQLGGIARFLGGFVARETMPAYWLGLAFLGLMAGVWGLLYVRVRAILPGPAWQRGVIYGVAVWLVGSVVLVPLLAVLQPAGTPAGTVMLGLAFGGLPSTLTALLAHVVYGLVLAAYIRNDEKISLR